MKIKGSPTPKKIVNKCVGAKVQDKKTGWISNIQNSQLLTLSLPTEEIFQVHSQKRPVENLPVVDFRSQPREIQLPKPLNTKLSVFLFLFWFSFPSKKVWTALSVSDTNFFSVLEALPSEKIPTNNRGLRVVKALLLIHQPDRVARKASDVSAADWRYQTHQKKYRIFSRVLLRLFSGLEILVQHLSLYDKTHFLL